MKKKSLPQAHGATRQQNPDAKAEIPFEGRATSTPKLQNVCLGILETATALQTTLTASTRVTVTLLHRENSPEDTLQSQ